MSIAKNQKAFLNSELVNLIGEEQDLQPAITGVLNLALEEFGSKFIDKVRKNIEDDKLNASGFLKSKIDYETSALGSDLLKFKILAPDYWEYANYGRGRGGMPPIQNIMDWIAHKGINVNNGKSRSSKSTLDKARSMAFAISKNIANKGTIKRFGYKGSQFLSDELNEDTLRDLGTRLAELTGRTVALSIKQNFETT